MAEVRTRIAPSPTGSPHVGTLYMGLFNRAFARRHGGKFLLRIEDTDQTRSRPEYEEQILRALRWAGLDWDEGPGAGGDTGPYRQSERSEIYARHAAELLETGAAYRCFCTPEDLAEMRARAVAEKRDTGYDGRCRALDPADAAARAAAGEVHVVRLRVPDEGEVAVADALRDEPVTYDLARVDDQVLMKSDGLPTYHLANVVDDHLMGVTHVIRGEEWLNSTPKHILLYRAFGWDEPVWAHMPLLLNPDRSKLSKRKNPTSITYYEAAGYLPEALGNYLCQMSYSRPGGEEKFSAEDFAGDFDLGRISLGGSVFDEVKLRALNARYLREDLDPEALAARLEAWRVNGEHLRRLLPMAQARIETLGDLVPLVSFLYAREVHPAPENLVPKGKEAEEVPPALQVLQWCLDETEAWDADGIKAAFERAAGFFDWKLRDVTGIGFPAVMGTKVGPPLFDSIALLGRDLTRDRLRRAQDLAGGLSGKKLKKLEKRWRA